MAPFFVGGLSLVFWLWPLCRAWDVWELRHVSQSFGRTLSSYYFEDATLTSVLAFGLAVNTIVLVRHRRRWLRIAAVATFAPLVAIVLILVAAGLDKQWERAAIRADLDGLSGSNIVAMDFGVGRGRDGWVSALRSTDSGKIELVLDALKASTFTSDHNCPPIVTLELVMKSDDPYEFYLLPGHEERFYEFRFRDEIYRVDRGAFLAALVHVGLAEGLLLADHMSTGEDDDESEARPLDAPSARIDTGNGRLRVIQTGAVRPGARVEFEMTPLGSHGSRMESFLEAWLEDGDGFALTRPRPVWLTDGAFRFRLTVYEGRRRPRRLVVWLPGRRGGDRPTYDLAPSKGVRTDSAK